MKLPFLNNKPKVEYFLSLVLRDDRINAFIFEQKENVMKVVNSQEESFSDSLDKTSFEDLLDGADKVISQAEDELDLPHEVQKTIFGLKENWIKDAKIKPEYLAILKKLSDSLGLTPVGFLTINEAVVSLLQKEEGAPPSAILIDVGKNNVTVATVRAGKVVEVKTTEIHQSPVFTVDTLLKHFETVEILPAKVILLNEDEELVQEFISHQWSKSLPFLHLPQIVSLQSDSIAKAFVIGLANQTGARVQTEFESEPVEQTAEPKEEAQPQVLQEPIAGEKTEIEPKPEPESNIQFIDTPDFFGFTNKDVAKAEPPKPEVAPSAEVFEEIPEDVALNETKKQLVPAALLVMWPGIKNFLVQLLTKAKTLNFRGLKVPNLPFGRGPILFALVPLAFFLLLLIYYLFFLKGTVVLSVNPKIVEKTQDITFSDSSNFEENTIKGEFVAQGEEGTISIATTGKKETGDKAKGTVTIFNSSKTTITFPVQTTITSSNGLDFLTLDKITVASESADVPPVAGKVNVNVEAKKFGTEYNFPSGTKFLNVGGNSDVSAKNDNPFSGGTKKEIQVVSKEDVAKLEENLIKSLEEKAKEDVSAKLSDSKDLLPEFIDETLEKKTLDKDVDEEAKTVKLTGTVAFEFLTYEKDEFINYLKTIFPSDQFFDENNLEIKFEDINKNKNEVATKANVKVKIVPKIDRESLLRKISGKSFEKAREEILKISQVEDAEIRFSPNLGFLPNFLPRNSKNININISEND